jgi:hypothetical protein
MIEILLIIIIFGFANDIVEIKTILKDILKAIKEHEK